MKQKMTANFFKEENIKLKTKVQMIEGELSKKEKLVDDLLMQQENYQPTGKVGVGKVKLESHLTMNLKRKIKDLQTQVQVKSEEAEALRRNIKSTKITEIEVEMKLYMDECTRLRRQLEEVIKSKDTFADPEELRIIEEKFQQQDQLIQSLRNENQELALAYQKRDEESRQLRDIAGEFERKMKKYQAASKETRAYKRQCKDKDKELNK